MDLICNHKKYEEIENIQDKLGLSKIIKKIVYSDGEYDTNMGYNHLIAITNYYHVQQERYQLLQECRDQFVTIMSSVKNCLWQQRKRAQVC